MVTKALKLAMLALMGTCTRQEPAQADMYLRAYTVVDPVRRTAQVRDLYIYGGKVYSQPQPGRGQLLVQNGKGKWLMPGLSDARVASWGNSSARKYDQLYQDMGSDTLLRAQLYCGVTRVGIGYGGWKLEEMLQRMALLGLPVAEGIKAGRILRGQPEDKSEAKWVLTGTAQVAPLLDKEWAGQGYAYLQASYGSLGDPYWPPLSREVLLTVLAWARTHGAKAWVQADTWKAMAEAVEAGAAVVQGLPEGEPPTALLKAMVKKGVYLAPLLSPVDLHVLRGYHEILDGPWGNALVQGPVRQSFKDPSLYEPRLKAYATWEGAGLASRNRGLARAAKAGVKLLVATESGWVAGAFQGISVHVVLQRLAVAGVDPWARLAAATAWPAEFFGKPAPLSEGSPADLLVLDADPLTDLRATTRISALWREGRLVLRPRLVPDLTRRRYTAH